MADPTELRRRKPIMDALLDDDLLGLIFRKIVDRHDRKSLSLVCKQWLRVEGLQRSALRVLWPRFLPNFLPRFPNLLEFRVSLEISNSLIRVLPNTCPRLQVLNLNCNDRMWDLFWEHDEVRDDDVDDEGLRDIAMGCRDLETVFLRGRSTIGDLGVVSLVGLSRNLRNLDLGFCIKVSDEALKSIAGLNNLEMLTLQGCRLITDNGLRFLAEGPVRNTLITLNLAECDRMTDGGLINLREMGALEDLNLARCRRGYLSDLGIENGVGANSSLKKLNLSQLFLTGSSMAVLARRCQSLEVLNLTGCAVILGEDLLAFSNHPSLKKLVLISSVGLTSVPDLERLVLACSTLECIVLNNSLRTLIPSSIQENILRRNCVIEWK